MTHHHDKRSESSGNPTHEELRAADFWGGGTIPLAPDVPGDPDPAIDRLGALPLAVRGRNPVDLLRVAYDAMIFR